MFDTCISCVVNWPSDKYQLTSNQDNLVNKVAKETGFLSVSTFDGSERGRGELIQGRCLLKEWAPIQGIMLHHLDL